MLIPFPFPSQYLVGGALMCLGQFQLLARVVAGLFGLIIFGEKGYFGGRDLSRPTKKTFFPKHVTT